MLTCISAKSIDDALLQLCKKSQDWSLTTRRAGNRMLEAPGPVAVEITDPTRRVIHLPHRNNSLPAQCAETLWVLAGRNDVDWLKFYLPRSPDFSDDGKTWRAGYGPRLRWYGMPVCDVIPGAPYLPVDQVKFVVEELKNNPESRRAVITLLSPLEDSHTPITTKDFNCTQSLSFMIVDGELELSVLIRSNDLIWGWSGINVFEFSVLQEVVAGILAVPIGSLYIFSVNLHVYQRHFNLVQKMSKACITKPSPARYNYLHSLPDLGGLDYLLNVFFVTESDIRDENCHPGELNLTIDNFMDVSTDNIISDLSYVVLAHCAAKRSLFHIEGDMVSNILSKDLKLGYKTHRERALS
jgi:thymidylate synthase